MDDEKDADRQNQESSEPPTKKPQNSWIGMDGVIVANSVIILSCPKCARKFRSQEKLDKHLEDHQSQRHVCKYCSKCFTTTGSLQRHQSLHTKGKQLKCSICDKSFTQKTSLHRHLLTHEEDKSGQKFSCSHCDKSFSHKHGLTAHISSVHEAVSGEPSALYQCPYCPKVSQLLRDKMKKNAEN